ncbi:MAG: hypothetical protein CL693_13645 [Cellvibrionaceae bacterium]|nr:hypothetical protein [Cellvibrionaceae bacterium]
MTDEAIFRLADIAGKGQADFQRDYKDVDPVVGIMRSLRDSGFAADAMTIDCLQSGKRIICILHDSTPEVVDYQFSYRDKDPAATFEKIALEELNASQFYAWMKDYFIGAEPS